jgi:hypothetical protein
MEAGSDLPLNPNNFSELSLLCEEFGASGLKRVRDLSLPSVATGSAVDFRFENTELAFGQKVVSGLAELKTQLGLLAEDCAGLKRSIGRLESETRTTAQSVSALEQLKPELDNVRTGLQSLQQDLQKCETRGEAADARLSAIAAKWESSQDDMEQAIREMRSATHLAVGNLKSRTDEELRAVRASIQTLKETVETYYLRGLAKVQCPMNEEKSLEGIISHLTKKHGGNVHEKGIVTITSKSIRNDPDDVAKNAADLTSSVWFCSKDEPDQWLCWDFRGIRVRPTHYTLTAYRLKSWVLEQSLDGERWTAIDRKTDNQDFTGDSGITHSFAVSNPAEARLLRLAHTGTRHDGTNWLSFRAVEFFGTAYV